MLDPDRPYAYLSEREPSKDAVGNRCIAETSTVFLTASRCPIGCAMCDLHRNTISHPTPAGAIPNQIRFAQQKLPAANWIKLYNSGNFFDVASIPPTDYPAIASLCDGYERVIIENHPRFGKHRHRAFRDLIAGKLEIAVGLESVQPRVLRRLAKQMSRDDFDRYAKSLTRQAIDLRVFLIVGTPYASIEESIRWTRLSLRHAIQAGARHVSLIPARTGHGWNGLAGALPQITLDHLADLFAIGLDDANGATCLSVDLWDIAQNLAKESERQLFNRLEAAILHQDASPL